MLAHGRTIAFWLLAGCVLFLDVRAERSSSASAPYPNRPIEVVVPFAPGGESDTIARRIIKPAIEKHGLLPQPLVITNRGGAGGTIGSRSVLDAKPDGYTVLMLHDAILTAKHYGNALYGPEAFEPVAATGANEMVLVATAESGIESLPQLMRTAKDHPDTIKLAVNFGAPTHFVALMLEKTSPGARFRFVQAGGGAHRLRELLGGHVQATPFSLSEYVQYRSDELRALAVFANRPVVLKKNPKDAKDQEETIPTAKEQGYDVVGTNAQMWWMPKGTPPKRVRALAEALRKAMQTEDVRQEMAKLRIDPLYLTGEDLQARLDEREKRIGEVQLRGARALPSFPRLLAIVLALTGGMLTWTEGRRRGWWSGASPEASGAGESIEIGTTTPRRSRRVATALGLMLAYAVTFSLGEIDFRWATLPFVVGMGLAMAESPRRAWITLTPLAVVLSFGVHWLLTHQLGARL